eukprot:6491228-Amphidinium_carterae.1
MGTEFNLNDFRAASIQDLLPWTQGGDLMDENEFGEMIHSVQDDVDDLGDDVGAGGATTMPTLPSALPVQHFPEHVFPRSMRVPGLMHIGHNALSGACSGLRGWASIETSMKHLGRLFGHKGPKERFVNTLLTGEHASYGQAFARGPKCPTFTAWRWRSISHVGRWLLKRRVLFCTICPENTQITQPHNKDSYLRFLNFNEPKALSDKFHPFFRSSSAIIQRVWSKERFLSEARDGQTPNAADIKDDNGVRLDLDVVDTAINGTFFWLYLEMLVGSLATVVDKISDWFSSCPCHADSGKTQDDITKKLRKAWSFRFGTSNSVVCPMAGKRAPELALGACTSLLQQCGLDVKHLLMESASTISADERDMVMQDFETGLQSLVATLVLKLDFTSALPFSLCGLAALDVRQAKAHAMKLMAQFDKYTHHETQDRLSRMFLDSTLAGSNRGDLEAWARCPDDTSGSLHKWPRLLQAILPLRFIPLVEWHAERPHSIVKRATAGKPSMGKRASLALRLPAIRCLLEPGPKRDRLIRLVEDCRTPEQVMRCFKLDSNPATVQLLTQRGMQASMKHAYGYVPVIARLLYELKPASISSKLASAERYQRRVVQQESTRDARLRETAALQRTTFHNLLSHCWFAEALQNEVLRPGVVLELRPEHCKLLRIAPIQNFGDFDDDRATCDLSDDVMAADTSPVVQNIGSSVCVKMVSATSFQQKLLKRKATSGHVLSKGDLVVLKAPAYNFDGEGVLHVATSISGQTTGELCVVSNVLLAYSDLSEMAQSVRIWTEAGRVQYWFPEFTTLHQRQTLAWMLEHNASREVLEISTNKTPTQ